MLTALGWWWHTPHDLADKIDPGNLARDTTIVLQTLWRLLTDPVLPLDYSAYAEALIAELDRIARGLAGRLDVASLRAAAAHLRDAAVSLRAAASAAEDGKARAIDRALMRASRFLVPINYTSGERFRHDPAVPLPPWPSLAPLRALAAAPSCSADVPFLAVEARQARNRVLHALNEAAAVLRRAASKGSDT
jgi:hypothetical protein